MLFLLTAGYIGYKRAPAVVRAPVDMALGSAVGAAQAVWKQVRVVWRAGMRCGRGGGCSARL